MKPEHRAMLVASLFAVDPVGLGGVCLRSPPQPLRELWLKILRRLLEPSAPWRRLPLGVTDRALFGGLDLTATVNTGRPVAESGLLAAADGGIVVIAMAERMAARTASCVQSAMDFGALDVPRDGVWLQHAASFGVVALDEGIDADEAAPISLLDRMAFFLDFNSIAPRTPLTPIHNGEEITAAQRQLPEVRMSSAGMEAICAASVALGADSCRATLLAVQAARVLAALAQRTDVVEEDLVGAVNLVLAHRATRAPPSEAPEDETAAEQPEQVAQESNRGADSPPDAPADDESAPLESLQERVVAAGEAAVPADLLAKLKSGVESAKSQRQAGRSGAQQHSRLRGRPMGARAGNPQRDGRLDVMATLQAAAPWQRLRAHSRLGGRIRVESSDFRVTRYRQRTRTLIVFAVDASGSAALHRLAEAKGAVELILADCYVRRDEVAVIGFRGRSAEILLPPTRSLVRAKLSLAGLPGGGATPLAAGISAALDMATKSLRRGDTPSIVVLTDGRANMGFDGAPGREAGHRDALRAAAAVRHANASALLIDTSPRPNPAAQQIAQAMRANYVPLPWSDSKRILDAVKTTSAGSYSAGT